MNRDGIRKSIWQEDIKKFPASININTIYDVAVVGGGITGFSTAFRLQKCDKECILLGSYNIGFGTTGGTTAHLNDFYAALVLLSIWLREKRFSTIKTC